jgi:hypothetical protein
MRLLLILAVVASGFAAGCNSAGGEEKTIKSTKAGDITVTLSSAGGELKRGENDLFISFTDSAGNPIDVGAASLNFHMAAMGSMAEMNSGAQLTTTETPGKYRGRVNIEMSGSWEAQVAYQGSHGTGRAEITVTAK